MHPLIGLVTLFTVLLLAACTAYAGRARGRYGVKAPAVTGPEGFERALRVQGNTNEAALMFLPALWVAAQVHVAWIAAALGALWLVARIWYAVAYANPARNRGPAFALSVAALVGLVLQGLWGVAWALALA
jgi:glutathione S-transferase